MGDYLEIENKFYSIASSGFCGEPFAPTYCTLDNVYAELQEINLITGEPPPPKMAGVVSLYTREYFSLVHDRLSEGGIASYWLPSHALAPADTRSISGAFCDVFEDCTLWEGAGLDWMPSRASRSSGWQKLHSSS